MPAAVAFRILLGVGDSEPTEWSGSAAVSPGSIASVQGWRFRPSDSATSPSWKTWSGSSLVLIGRQDDARITAGDVAQWRTTNSWEVVTSLSARLTRVYDAPAGVSGTRVLSPLESSWRASSSGTATSATSRSTRS